MTLQLTFGQTITIRGHASPYIVVGAPFGEFDGSYRLRLRLIDNQEMVDLQIWEVHGE